MDVFKKVVKNTSAFLTLDENSSRKAGRSHQNTSTKARERQKQMCRNIKTLFNFDPPATDEEIQEASLQFVRKLSGFHTPSKANEAAFNLAVEEIGTTARNLLDSLVTSTEPRDRELEIERARARNAKRFGTV
jgi:hypothetical protein